MSGQCWAVLGLWCFMEVSGRKNNPNGKACPSRVILCDFLGLCGAHVGQVGVQVGLMLGHLVRFMGFHGGFWKEKTNQLNTFRLGLILGALAGLCRANVGLCWVYVGPMLSHVVGFVMFHGSFWKEKKRPPTGKLVRDGYFV